MSVRDPIGTLHVRRFEQKSAIAVYALVDLSASMSFAGGVAKMQIVADLCATLAASTRRIGDSFGLIGCNEHIVPEFFLPATRSRGGEADMVERLRDYVPVGRGSEGLIEAANYLAGRRKLVFVLSDFYMPLATIERLFEALSQHDVVPTARVARRSRDRAAEAVRHAPGLAREMAPRRSRAVARAECACRELWAWRLRILGPIDWDRLSAYLMGEAA